ncbi:hypothetical protein [Agromyces sp. NPDC058110]|uniref:hypothetical protein n=1 Tax=Agromyces sp. NPDC058110 TaxID=3346345 RepID=UPI0036D85685
MTTSDDWDHALHALWSGTAATPDQVGAVRSLGDGLHELAEDLGIGARSGLPEAPVAWCSPAGTAYAEVLVGLRETLTSTGVALANAADAVSSCASLLQARVDEHAAALAMRPAS